MNGLYLQCKSQYEGTGGSEKFGRNECILHRWPRSPEINHCRRSYHYVKNHLVDSEGTTYGLKHAKWSNISGITREITNSKKKIEDIFVRN